MTLMDWKPIESAPKDGTPVRLRSHSHDPFDYLFTWDGERGRWATKAFAIARAVDAWWDESGEQPTHFAFPRTLAERES